MHIVVTRFSSLGDVVIQTSFIKALKIKYPNLFISFVTLDSFVSLVENHPYIDKVYGYKKKSGIKDIVSLFDLSKKISIEREVNFIIDLHGTTRSFILKTLNPGVPAINMDKRRIERFFFITLKLNLLKNTKAHQFRMISDLEGLLDLDLGNGGTLLAPIQTEKILDSCFHNYIVIAPIASFEAKRWSIQKFKLLIEAFLKDAKYSDFQVVVVAGSNDNYVDELKGIDPTRFINLKGKTSINQSRSIIQGAQMVIGNDTGMGHIAESYGVPSFVIFGPTHPDLGFAPFLEKSEIITANTWCSPCSGTGSKKCFRKEQYCMKNICVEDVYSRLEKVL